jgi:hypothetical protein
MGGERRGGIGWAQKMVEEQAGELWGNLAMCFFHPFLLTKIGFIIPRKGPRTQVIFNSSFIKEWIDIKKAEELSYISSYRTLPTDKNQPSLYTLNGDKKSGHIILLCNQWVTAKIRLNRLDRI